MSHPKCDNRYCEGGCSLCAALERIDVLEPGAQNYNRYRVRAEKAEAFLERNGYRSCDIAACNCGSWHQQRERPVCADHGVPCELEWVCPDCYAASLAPQKGQGQP